MPALQRAIALAQMQHLAEGIGQHLHLDVARMRQIFLDINGIIAEGGFRFGARGGKRQRQFGSLARHFHAAPAAARRRLDENGIADIGGDARCFLVAADRALRTGNGRDSQFLHRDLRRDLVAHQADVFGQRADEGEAVFLHDLGEARALREKSVAGMNRFRAGDFAGRDDLRHVEIALCRGRRADAHAFVGEPHMHGIGIGGGMNRHRRDPHLLAGAVDAQCDLAAIGDEDFFEHLS